MLPRKNGRGIAPNQSGILSRFAFPNARETAGRERGTPTPIGTHPESEQPPQAARAVNLGTT